MQAILERRGGELLNLDRALLWSEPLARGWNTYLKNVRTGLRRQPQAARAGHLHGGAAHRRRTTSTTTMRPTSWRRAAARPTLDALQAFAARRAAAVPAGLAEDEALVARYAAQMTRDVKVDDALFAQMQERFDTTELVEITAAIATYNMVARFLVALGVTPED